MDSISLTMQRWARESAEAALTGGAWAKVGKSAYQRATGESVTKRGSAWSVRGGKYDHNVFQSRAAAFSAIDYSHKVA